MPDARTAAAATAAKSFFKITLIRSGIGMTKRQNAILASMGLRKRMSIVYHPVSPDVAGKIMKVKELLAVSEVPPERVETRAQRRARRAPPPGFVVEGTARGAPERGDE